MAERAPCCLRTVGITDAQEKDLFNAYLNMSPAQDKEPETEISDTTAQVEFAANECATVGVAVPA